MYTCFEYLAVDITVLISWKVQRIVFEFPVFIVHLYGALYLFIAFLCSLYIIKYVNFLYVMCSYLS
jgi:hypothetical protein